MQYSQTTPCKECPFLKKMAHGFTMRRLREFALSEFPCHKSCDTKENVDGCEEFVANDKSVACAGAMIFLAKRKKQYTYGFDDTKLNMNAAVR